MPPAVREEYDAVNYPGIVIQHESGVASSFHHTIREFLNEIASEDIGRQLLAGIATNSGQGCDGFGSWNGARLLIKRSSVNAMTIGKPGEEGGNKCVRVSEENARNGTGSPSMIDFNTNIYTVPGKGSRPPCIGLAHEMCHALHNALGEAYPDLESEESRTVGIGEWAGEAICENTIRDEHGIDRRQSY